MSETARVAEYLAAGLDGFEPEVAALPAAAFGRSDQGGEVGGGYGQVGGLLRGSRASRSRSAWRAGPSRARVMKVLLRLGR
jgi:hypothetical protein